MKRLPILLSLFAVGCGPAVPVASGGTTSGGVDDDGSAGAGPTSDPPDAGTTNATTATSASSSVDGSSSNGGEVSSTAVDDHGGFIDYGDGGGTSVECDIWIDDCLPGEKCMPWANDGGNSWNATKCSPLAEDPNQVGESCTVEGSGVSGIDDCEARSMCWDVNPETNVGTCVAFCNGSAANPTCSGDACTSCAIANEGVLILCLPICDPLWQDCPEGMGCWPSGDAFRCVPAPQSELWAGDACSWTYDCPPGLACVDAARIPGCTNRDGCCTVFCDVNADSSCADILPGTECIPWFDEGEAPPCFAQIIGGCLLPE